ncbi:MAG: hypothetical protein H6740_25835 [Alphaproteobacteria bacterium]|nr:hypothetical protein [Alphaproteobacteria bacterium]
MWSSLLGPWLLNLLACGRAPSPEQAYLAALDADAAEACLPISDPQLRGECVSLTALRLARQGRQDEATAACALEGLGRWQGECWFMVADGLEAEPALARTLCERAGPHRGQCLSHAAGRLAGALFEEPGGEPEKLTQLEALVADFRSGPRVQEEAWRMLVAQRAAARPGAPFSLALCGDLEPERCADILAARGGGVCGPVEIAPDAEAVLAAAQARCAPGPR